MKNHLILENIRRFLISEPEFDFKDLDAFDECCGFDKNDWEELIAHQIDEIWFETSDDRIDAKMFFHLMEWTNCFDCKKKLAKFVIDRYRMKTELANEAVVFCDKHLTHLIEKKTIRHWKRFEVVFPHHYGGKLYVKVRIDLTYDGWRWC